MRLTVFVCSYLVLNIISPNSLEIPHAATPPSRGVSGDQEAGYRPKNPKTKSALGNSSIYYEGFRVVNIREVLL